MARFKFSLNEGTLLRRTALHVAAFVLGTAAFLALASFLLTTILKGLLPSEREKDASGSGEDSSSEAAATASGTSKAGGRPPPRKRRPVPAPAPAAPADDE